MTPEDFARAMQIIYNDHYDDTEVLHAEMDTLLIKTLRELGYSEGCDLYVSAPKWYA